MAGTIKAIYRVLLGVIIGYGLYLTIFSGGTDWGALRYFTIQSNLLVLFTLVSDLAGWSDGDNGPFLNGLSLLCILMTGLVFNFVLYNIFVDWGTAGYTTQAIITHLVAPIGFLLDWVFLQKHGQLRWGDALGFLIYPLLYAAVSIVQGYRTGRVLYFFFDVRGGVSPWLAVVLLAFLLVAALVVICDAALAPRQTSRRSNRHRSR